MGFCFRSGPCVASHKCVNLQSNFNGSNTFGTMEISSRQGKFEPMRVDIAPGQEA